jgi:hypothetical protein
MRSSAPSFFYLAFPSPTGTCSTGAVADLAFGALTLPSWIRDSPLRPDLVRSEFLSPRAIRDPRFSRAARRFPGSASIRLCFAYACSAYKIMVMRMSRVDTRA